MDEVPLSYRYCQRRRCGWLMHLIRAVDRLVGRIDELIPEARTPALHLIAGAADQGASVRVGLVYRSSAQQTVLFMQGRGHPLDTMNAARAAVGWGPITLEENSRTVTRAKAGSSWHEYRRAMDLVPIDSADDADLSDPDLPIWDVPWWPGLGEIGKHLGFRWGGDWKNPDRPHFQWSKGVTLAEMRG